MASTHSKWPDGVPSRLRPFCQPHIVPRFQFSRVERVFTIGSCFARNIEEHLHRLGMVVPALDFVVPRTEYEGRPNGLINKYTPAAILSEIRYALDDGYPLALDDHFIEGSNGAFVDLHLNSPRGVSLDRARERRLQIQSLFRQIRGSTLLIITLGLTEAWFDNERQCYVNQAPPPAILARNSARFLFKPLNYDTSLAMMREAIKMIGRAAPAAKIVITVSPVPIGRTFTADDVIVANMLSKSTLRAVAGALVAEFDGVQYFPAYEMATISAPDEIWADDQIHVRDDAVGRIVGTFVTTFCGADPATMGTEGHFAARLRLSSGQADSAYHDLKRVLDPQHELLLRDFAEACDRSGRHDEAVEAAKRLVEAFPDHDQNWLLLARIASRAGAREDSLAAIDHAIAIAPDVSAYHAHRSSIQYQLGNVEAAMDDAETALRVFEVHDDRDLERWQKVATRAAKIMVKSHHGARAVALYNEFAPRIDGSGQLQGLISEALEATGDLDRAIVCAQRAAESTAEPAAYRRWSELYRRAGQNDRAADVLAEALRLTPSPSGHESALVEQAVLDKDR